MVYVIHPVAVSTMRLTVGALPCLYSGLNDPCGTGTCLRFGGLLSVGREGLMHSFVREKGREKGRKKPTMGTGAIPVSSCSSRTAGYSGRLR